MWPHFILCAILLISLALAGEVDSSNSASAPSPINKVLQLYGTPLSTLNDEAINRAIELIGRKKLDEAENILKKYPDSPDAKFNIGIIQLIRGRKSEANQAFAETTNLNPEFDVAWENQLCLCEDLGLDNKLKEVFKKMKTKSPDEFAKLAILMNLTQDLP